MPPIKKITPPEDEFFAHIKESLIGYEEAYTPGAWEEFENKGKKKTILIFWVRALSGAAAILLIGTGLLLFVKTSQKSKNAPTSMVKQNRAVDPTSSKQQLSKVETQINSSAIQSTRRLVQAPVLKSATDPKSNIGTTSNIDTKLKNDLALINNPTIPKDNPTILNSVTEPDAIAMNTAPANKSDEIVEERKNITIQDFLTAESKLNKASSNKKDNVRKDNKWAMGLMVAPSFGNSKKINMGYGLSMDYALSDKFSLGSGISYNELAATKKPMGNNTPASPMAPSFIARSSKSLESTDAQLSGIDIPLEIKYSLSKKLYANIGISAFAVIEQKQSNNYVQQSIVQQSISNDAGLTQLATVMVAEKVSEPAPQSEVQQNKYLGFYNFSFGFKQKVSKSNTLSIEPFLKIPMKEVATQNLNLIGTGVKLKFDF